MKTVLSACVLAMAIGGAAQAAEVPSDSVKLDMGVYKESDAQALRTDVWWYSRYGKRCYHGRRWIRACH